MESASYYDDDDDDDDRGLVVGRTSPETCKLTGLPQCRLQVVLNG